MDIVDNGELLKETFDITEVPSIRYIFQGKFHTLKWKQTGHLWSAADIVAFVSDIDQNRLWAFERKRVKEGLDLYMEYWVRFLAENHFDDIMNMTRETKRWLNDYLGYEVKLKDYNRNFGKKKEFRDSQIRTVLELVAWPFFILQMLIISLIIGLAWCIWRKCCYNKTPTKIKEQ